MRFAVTLKNKPQRPLRTQRSGEGELDKDFLFKLFVPPACFTVIFFPISKYVQNPKGSARNSAPVQLIINYELFILLCTAMRRKLFGLTVVSTLKEIMNYYLYGRIYI